MNARIVLQMHKLALIELVDHILGAAGLVSELLHRCNRLLFFVRSRPSRMRSVSLFCSLRLDSHKKTARDVALCPAEKTQIRMRIT